MKITVKKGILVLLICMMAMDFTEAQERQTRPAPQSAPGSGLRLRDLNFEVIKLSYIQTDRAIAILKSMGYSVIEFDASSTKEVAGDYKFTPKEYPKLNQSAITQSQLPVIIKLPDTETISLVEKETVSRSKKGTTLGANLGGIPMIKVTTGEPMQRLLIGYKPGSFEPVAKLMEFINNEIDVAASQILLEALVIELDSDKIDELGVDFSRSGSGFSATFPPPSEETGAINPVTIVLDRTLLGNAETFQASVDALVSSQAAEILSKPSVLVLDGRQARIQVGQQIPIVRTTSTDFASEKSVDYIPVGIVLNLRPRVNQAGTRITIQVETIISETEERIGTAVTAGVLEAPVINNRRVQSIVRVANNTPFIIGGLIAKKISDNEGGIPYLKDIPGLGGLFSFSTQQSTRKEVIVVVTPHVITEAENNFSRVIPQDSDLFNAFGNQSFPNSYRVQNTDVYDLSFIYESPIFRQLLESIREEAAKDATKAVTEPYKSLLAGRVPGEDILVRRMIYDIIERMDYYKHIAPEKVLFFLDAPDDPAGFKIRPMGSYIKSADVDRPLKLSYSIRGKATVKKPFVRPTAQIDYVTPKKGQAYKQLLKELNARGSKPRDDVFTILIGENKHERRLYEILILKKVLEMNPDLDLTLEYYQPGIEILFPSPDVLEKNNHIVDRDAAKFFYEINDYYGSFESVFNRSTSKLSHLIKD